MREGRRLKSVLHTAAQSKPCVTQAPLKRERKKMGIIGTSTGCNIQVVKTNLVSVFATKFSPNLDAETLSAYLKQKLVRVVTCRKIESAQNRFSSFYVTMVI